MTGCADTPMACRSLSPCSLIAAMICACASEPWPDPPPVDRAAFLTEHAAWRSRDEQSVRHNWVGLAGLWLLSEERTAFGTDSSLPIVLAGRGPRRVVGTFVRRGRTVQIEPSGSGLLLSNDNRPYHPIDSTVVLRTDNDSVPSYLRFGSFRFWIHVVDDRDYVRVMDVTSPRLKGFTLAPEYEPDPRWRVPPRLHRFNRPQELPVPGNIRADGPVSVVVVVVFLPSSRQLLPPPLSRRRQLAQ